VGPGEGDHELTWLPDLPVFLLLQVPPPVTPRPSKPARTRHPSQDPPMPPTPSPTYERLRDTIARRMRMSHIYQPLMLMELLGHGFARQQPARPPRRT
jgi:hypothetical protein